MDSLNQLEAIFLYNKRQLKSLHKIRRTIDAYGVVKIVAVGSNLTISMGACAEHKILYALDGNSGDSTLLGLVIYLIEGYLCQVVHLAVHPSCGVGGEYEYQQVTLRLLEKLRKQILSSRHVKSIGLPYCKSQTSLLKPFINICE